MCDEGLDIRKELNDNHAFAKDCEVLFSERKGSNGFKFDSCNDSVLDCWLQQSKSCMVLCIKQKKSPMVYLG
jgi:hypothetical protein